MIPRKIIFFVGLCLGAAAVGSIVHAEAGNPASDQAPTAAPAPTTPAMGHALRKIVLTESIDVAQTFVPPADSGFVVLSPGLASIDLGELSKPLAAGENRIVEEGLLAAIAQVIENFLRQNNRPQASAIIPSQNIAAGVLRVVVQLGPTLVELAEKAQTTPWKIRNINVQGTHWFSESLLRQKLRIEQGGIVKWADLDQALNWTNNSPFRRVRVKLDPVPNSSEADLTVAVQDALPLRLSTSYDNAGNDILGQSHFIASASYANLWGLDHQVSYQYITTEKAGVFQGHGFDYRVPLPWRHYVQLSASYLHAQPEILNGLFKQDGRTLTTDLRYTVPLRRGSSQIDTYAAMSFKQTNNSLTWDPHANPFELPGVTADIFQLTLGASTVRRDKQGAWGFGANLTLSPGKVNSRNSEAAFNATRPGATPRYVFGNFSIQRLLNIKNGWNLSSRAVVQLANNNLMPSEQMTIGGGTSVRGFRENVFAGDQAFVFTTDLLAPALTQSLPQISKTRGPLETRFLVFYDAASSRSRYAFDTDPKRKPLASAGVGVRMSLATNFSLNADYGWQLTRLPFQVEEHARAHIKVILAY